MTPESFQPAVKAASPAQAKAELSKAQPHSGVSSTLLKFHEAPVFGDCKLLAWLHRRSRVQDRMFWGLGNARGMLWRRGGKMPVARLQATVCMVREGFFPTGISNLSIT